MVDTYPLGVAIVSDYNVNGNPYILIDIRELTSRLQKTTIKGRKNKPLFFNSIVDEIKNNYPPERALCKIRYSTMWCKQILQHES